MVITYQTTLKSDTQWFHKGYGGVFVTKEEHITHVYDALVAQDDYWECANGVNDLIIVIPEKILNRKDENPQSTLHHMCKYAHKQDIYDVEKLISDLKTNGIDVFIMSYFPEFED